MPSTANTQQLQAWNGPNGAAWVALQDTLDAMFKPFEDLLADSVRVTPGERQRVLDVGCGTGATTLAIAERLSEHGSCTGIDISQPMVATAQNRARVRQLPVGFIVADAQTHSFDDARFDHVVSRFGVMFFDDPVSAFGNLRCATRSGGRLAFYCWRHPDDNPFMNTAERVAGTLLPALEPRAVGRPGPAAFADRQRIRRILDAAGWSAIGVKAADVTCTLPIVDLLPYLTQIGPIAKALPSVDAETRTKVISALREAYQPFIVGDSVEYTAACWLVEATAA
ncbi:SAM-dependent methyltransferase [Mycobacterium conspicuum]|nr:SAM-dependent methyltransferase [Mycobacterium conspicuum]